MNINTISILSQFFIVITYMKVCLIDFLSIAGFSASKIIVRVGGQPRLGVRSSGLVRCPRYVSLPTLPVLVWTCNRCYMSKP